MNRGFTILFLIFALAYMSFQVGRGYQAWEIRQAQAKLHHLKNYVWLLEMRGFKWRPCESEADRKWAEWYYGRKYAARKEEG